MGLQSGTKEASSLPLELVQDMMWGRAVVSKVMKFWLI
jgi:hypothetical protein